MPSAASSALAVAAFCFLSLSARSRPDGLCIFFFFPGVDGFSLDVTTTVDIRDQNNKELSMRLVTNIQSGDVFYTDLNGFQVGPRTDPVHLFKTKEGRMTA